MTVVDCQCHWYPRSFCEAQLGRSDWRRDGDGYVFEPSPGEVWRFGREFVDLERQFEVMTDAGIDVLVSSPVIAGDVSEFELDEAREVCAHLNEELAGAQRMHPGRFYGLAVLPLQDAGAAVETLDDAVCRLGLVGVLVHSNVAGGSIATPELWPVYQRCEELGVPIFLHPTRAFGLDRMSVFRLEPPLGYMFDTTVAALSLVLGGVLDEHPRLAVVHPHLGGTLPYLIDRVDVYRGLGRWRLERPVREYLPRFHTDTVSDSPGALRLALELYGIDRVLFASDHPYFRPADEVSFVRANLDGDAAARVFGVNARELLKLPERAATR